MNLAIEDLLAQNRILYQLETESLSETQLNLLKAIASGVTQGFNSVETILKYRLGTSANVRKQKKTLIEKELIDLSDQKMEFLDPVFEQWFIKNILKINT
jgi:uncharacterized protein